MTSFHRRPRVVLVVDNLVVSERVAGNGHPAAALRAACRLEQAYRSEGTEMAVRMCMVGVPRFAGASSHCVDLRPRDGLSIVDRVLIATQPFDPHTSARSSARVRDFLDYLIDSALEASR